MTTGPATATHCMVCGQDSNTLNLVAIVFNLLPSIFLPLFFHTFVIFLYFLCHNKNSNVKTSLLLIFFVFWLVSYQRLSRNRLRVILHCNVDLAKHVSPLMLYLFAKHFYSHDLPQQISCIYLSAALTACCKKSECIHIVYIIITYLILSLNLR